MAHRRAQSADRVDGSGGSELARLTDLLAQALTRQPAAPRETFKAPEYDGATNVEEFILQFSEVAEANEWTPGATLLHLRNRLKEEAKECGQGPDVQTVFNALRVRFGMTGREARVKLANLKKGPSVSFHGHATEIERLCKIAYQGVPARQRADMAVETFCNTLGNLQLQRHLLAVATPDLESAVRAANEFMQLGGQSSAGIRMIQPEEDQDMGMVRQTADPIQQLMRIVKDLAADVAQLKKQSVLKKDGRSGQDKPTSVCHLCKQEGHWKRNCPKLKEALRIVQQGNESSPQR